MNGLFLSIVFLLLSTNLFSASENCTTTSDGDFNDASIWSCGSVPDKDDNVTINHDVVLNVNFTGGGKISGDWTIASTASLIGATYSLEFGSGTSVINGTLEINDLNVNNGAVINFASTSDITIHGDFTNNNNSDEVTVNTSNFSVTGDLNNGNGGSITGTGTIDVTGTVNNDAGATIFTCTGADCCSGGCTLAIELLDFSVNIIDSKVHLKWTTGSEVNNSHFIIERSFDGIIFEEIGLVDGNGNSFEPINYTFVDQNITVDYEIIYYRIIDVDYDGVKTYHNIKNINKTNSNKLITLNNNLDNFKIINFSDNTYSYSIYDIKGVEILNNLLEPNGFIIHFNNEFKNGVYFLKVSEINYYKKIILLK